MYEVLQDFEVPGLPKFVTGTTCNPDEATAQVLESRGLIKATKKRADEKPAEENPKEDKKTKLK
jgi:hypothetical protein